MSQAPEPKTSQELQQELADLRYQLQVAEDTIEAIRTGSVDALAIQENGVTKIFTLEGAEQTYRVLVENMSEGAVILNHQGIILYANSLFARLVNLPLGEVIGSSFNRFLSPEYQDRFREMFDQGWNQHTKGECILQPTGKDWLHVYISLTTILDKGTPVLGVIITNLSEQKELEKLTQAKEDLSKKNEELLKINNDLDTFVYTASHDLKSPVLNIEGLVIALEEVIEEGATFEEIKLIISHISNSVAKFKSTILDLTEISKVQKSFSESPENINCQEIIQVVIAGLKEVIARAQAEVVIHLGNCQEIQFSKKNFQSIVYNLLSNAIKYHAPDRKPFVFISMDKTDDFVVLTVQDNGLGIDLKNEAKLFGMFERLHNHVEGSGVGLYIVKRILDNAGGHITVESEVGTGSTFKVFFKKF